jgi:hypothetical protein
MLLTYLIISWNFDNFFKELKYIKKNGNHFQQDTDNNRKGLEIL